MESLRKTLWFLGGGAIGIIGAGVFVEGLFPGFLSEVLPGEDIYVERRDLAVGLGALLAALGFGGSAAIARSKTKKA